MTGKGPGIRLTNNEIKEVMKIIKSLEKGGILLKGITRKSISQEGRFIDFLRLLMTAGLILMKRVFTPLAKSLLIPLVLTPATSSTDAANQNKIYGSGTTTLIISNEEIKDIIYQSRDHLITCSKHQKT